MEKEAADRREGDTRSTEKAVEVVRKDGNIYLPAVGYASVLLFSTHVTNPRLLRSLFSPNDLLVSNVVWLSAHIGSGYYIYTRQHVQRATPWLRAAYSVSGAVLFNFGTVLFWATAKQVLPANDALRTLFGLASGAAFLTVARRYLEFVDSSVTSSAAVTAE